MLQQPYIKKSSFVSRSSFSRFSKWDRGRRLWEKMTQCDMGGRGSFKILICTVSFYPIPTNHSEEFEQSRSIPAALKFTHQSEGDFRMKWQELMNHVFWITRSNCGQNVAILKKMNIFSATCGYWMSRHMEETEAENWLIYLVCM